LGIYPNLEIVRPEKRAIAVVHANYA
jgi:hypothetical protein